jgi:opacity protein-like surface antigen
MARQGWLLAIVFLLAAARPAVAADITGKWTATFDTQIGVQTYTYDFMVKDGKLTGTAKSTNGDSTIADGKVEGDKVSFVETLTFQGMELRITYTGKIVSNDEIKFTRNVADFATEELVAKRAK